MARVHYLVGELRIPQTAKHSQKKKKISGVILPPPLGKGIDGYNPGQRCTTVRGLVPRDTSEN